MPIPSRNTAAALLQLLRNRNKTPAGKLIGGELSRAVLLVRCTSATAAGGSGVSAECYPAVVVDPDSSELLADQPELGNMWLTLVDGSTPTADAIYQGVMAGKFDPDPGGTSDPRPRVFAVALAAGGDTTIDGGHTTQTAITSDNTWVADSVGTMLALTAGSWLIHAHYHAEGKVSALSGTNDWIAMRMFDTTNSAVVPRSTCTVLDVPVINKTFYGTASVVSLYTLSASANIRFEGFRISGSTWTTASIGSNLAHIFNAVAFKLG